MPAWNVFRRLQSAERTESSAAAGVAAEIVSYEQRRSRLAAIAHSTRVAAATYPRRQPEPGVTAEAWMESENSRANAQTDMLRQVRQMARETGTDLGQFNQALALASAPSGADFTHAVAAAEAALSNCERELGELEAERSRRGRRLGELRASIKQGRDWLAAHGHPEVL